MLDMRHYVCIYVNLTQAKVLFSMEMYLELVLVFCTFHSKKCDEKLYGELGNLPSFTVDLVEPCVPLLSTQEEDEYLEDFTPTLLEDEVVENDSSCEFSLCYMP